MVKAIRGDIRPVDVALRLRHDRRVPDLARAGPRLRRQDGGARRPRRRALGLARPRLHAGRRAGARHPRAGRHRQREGAAATRSRRSSARRSAQKRGTWYPPYLSYRRGDRPPPMRSRRGRWSSPTPPTMRAAARPPTTPTSSAACWSAAAPMRRSARCGTRSRSQFCHAAGVGATFPLRFGGKTSPASGLPIDAEATVIGLAKDGEQTFGRAKVKFGDGAGIRVGGVEVALIAHRTQALGTEIFSAVEHRSRDQALRRREIDQPLLCRLRADRRQGDLLRRRGPLAARCAQISIHEGAPHHLAACRTAGGAHGGVRRALLSPPAVP